MDLLSERLVRLDEALETVSDAGDPLQLLTALTWLLSDVTNAGGRFEDEDATRADTADELVRSASLLRACMLTHPWLSDPYSHETRQIWTRSSGRGTLHQPPIGPCRERFRSPKGLNNLELRRRPLPCGLFTSTSWNAAPTMWNLFMLQNTGDNEDANLWRRPWVSWALSPRRTARICLIDSASDWVQLINSSHISSETRMLSPNWAEISSEFDAVHFSLPAVCAIDGLSFYATDGRTAPETFTVESTLWLNWVFDRTEPFEPIWFRSALHEDAPGES